MSIPKIVTLVKKPNVSSGAKLARKFGISSRAFEEMVSAGVIPKPVGARGFDDDAVTAAYVLHLRNRASRRENNRGVYKETELLRAAQRKNIELKNKALEGSLVAVEEIRPAWERVARLCKRRLRRLRGL